MLGDIVKAQRTARRQTQRKLAQRAGIGQAHISLLEHNRVPAPELDTVWRWPELLASLSIPCWKGPACRESRQLPATDPPRSHLDYWVKALVALGPQLTPTQQMAVLDHAEALQRQNSK